MQFINFILIGFLSSISIYRIDLGFGKLGFNLIPAYTFIPIMFFIAIIKFNKIRIPFKLAPVIYISLVLYISNLISLIQAQDIIQIKRIFLTTIIFWGSLIFIVLFHSANNKRDIIFKFIKYSIIINLLFCLGEVYYSSSTFDENAKGFINLSPSRIGSFFIRPSGGALDANLGAYFFITIFILCFYFELPKRFSILSSILVALSFSRSAIVILFLALLLISIINIQLIIKKLNFRIMISVLILFFALLFITSLYYEFLSKSIILAIQTRVSDKGSSDTHLRLYNIAFNNIYYSPDSLIIGHGYSASSLTAQSVFRNYSGANFHSEYMTFLYDNGLFSLFYYIVMLTLPFYYFIHKINKKNAYIIVLFICFISEGILYQQLAFQYYFLTIILGWYLLVYNVDNEEPI